MCIKDNNLIVILVSFLYSSGMIFYSLLPSAIIMIITMLYVAFVFSRVRVHRSYKETLFLSSILLIPTSTISLIGTDTGRFPISWFHLFVIILFIVIIYREQIERTYCMLLLCFICYICVSALFTSNIIDAFKQVFTISLFLTSFISGVSLKKSASKHLLDDAIKYYIVSVSAFSLQVVMQRDFITRTNKIIGHYGIMGRGRIAYAGLMGDYSFATLYIATGIMIVLICFLDRNLINVKLFGILEVYFLFSMLAISSRTGLFSLAVIMVLYLGSHLKKIDWKLGTLIGFGCVSVPIVFNKLIAARSGQDLMDSSGRIENYRTSLAYIIQYPIIGVGLGLGNLKNDYQLSVPHNFFVQYFLQIGSLGVFILLLFFIKYLKRDLVWNSPMKWIFGIIVIGSMFIPDVFSSRFYFVIIIMSMMPPIIRRNENVEEKSRETIYKNNK